MTSGRPRSIFHPEINDLTENERAWVGFLRLLSADSDPAPTLKRVQAFRFALLGKRMDDKEA